MHKSDKKMHKYQPASIYKVLYIFFSPNKMKVMYNKY